ncbi:MAG: glyoxalase [Crocinitomicaceae bacterium]|nr:glyoxalase [Crocinitomicaceae bacterium]|tara:strand:+ start:10516 stop:10896 length:381 start_codon:yes stop_codon:yes gene_type:complete
MSQEMNVVTWFEIPVNDMDRAVGFYQNILDVELNLNDMGPNKMAWFPWSQGAPGSAGTLIKGEGYAPSAEGSVVYFSCEPDLQESLDKVESNGGKVLVPKMGIGEFGFIAQIMDTEGNRVALHSSN